MLLFPLALVADAVVLVAVLEVDVVVMLVEGVVLFLVAEPLLLVLSHLVEVVVDEAVQAEVAVATTHNFSPQPINAVERRVATSNNNNRLQLVLSVLGELVVVVKDQLVADVEEQEVVEEAVVLLPPRISWTRSLIKSWVIPQRWITSLMTTSSKSELNFFASGTIGLIGLVCVRLVFIQGWRGRHGRYSQHCLNSNPRNFANCFFCFFFPLSLVAISPDVLLFSYL
jgi:hypothetical protein